TVMVKPASPTKMNSQAGSDPSFFHLGTPKINTASPMTTERSCDSAASTPTLTVPRSEATSARSTSSIVVIDTCPSEAVVSAANGAAAYLVASTPVVAAESPTLPTTSLPATVSELQKVA